MLWLIFCYDIECEIFGNLGCLNVCCWAPCSWFLKDEFFCLCVSTLEVHFFDTCTFFDSYCQLFDYWLSINLLCLNKEFSIDCWYSMFKMNWKRCFFRDLRWWCKLVTSMPNHISQCFVYWWRSYMSLSFMAGKVFCSCTISFYLNFIMIAFFEIFGACVIFNLETRTCCCVSFCWTILFAIFRGFCGSIFGNITTWWLSFSIYFDTLSILWNVWILINNY